MMKPAPTEEDVIDLQRLVYETTSEAILWLDGHGRVLRANPAARTLPWDVVERRLLSQWQRDPEIIAFRAELRARGRASIELRTDDRRLRILQIEGRSFRGETVVFLRDATARRLLEQEVSDLLRVATLGELTAAIVHDFGNVVAPIACLVEALGHEVKPNTRGGALVDELDGVTRHAVALLRQLLSFVRREPTRIERVEVSSIVEQMRPMLQRLVGPHIDLTLSLDEAAGAATVDRLHLERVVLNLVANARDAMPQGGRVTVRTHAVIADDARAEELSAPSHGAYVALTVSDEGAGMTEDVRARALDPFFSTKTDGRGSGLGLATAHRFAMQAGGSITVRSEVGDGTVVSLYLPRAAENGEETPKSSLVVSANGSGSNGSAGSACGGEGALRRA
jgi:signal transduction histidine kinase